MFLWGRRSARAVCPCPRAGPIRFVRAKVRECAGVGAGGEAAVVWSLRCSYAVDALVEFEGEGLGEGAGAVGVEVDVAVGRGRGENVGTELLVFYVFDPGETGDAADVGLDLGDAEFFGGVFVVA